MGQTAPRGVASRLLVIGGSAGALAPLLTIVEGLRTGVDAAVAVCLHRSATAHSVLPSVLSRRSALQATEPQTGDPVHPGYIFVAPPGHHLEIADGTFSVNMGPKINGHRPSIDTLFRSAARAFDSRTVGILLSGTLDDGAAGLHAIEDAGGVAIIQDPDDAEFPDLPKAGIDRTGAPVVVGREDLLEAARAALGTSGEQVPKRRPSVMRENGTIDPRNLGAADEPGELVGVTCPDCGGSLWLTGDAKEPILTCRVGHSMGPESLQELHSDRVDWALWAALRNLEEQVAVAEFMRELAQRRGDAAAAARHDARAGSAREQAGTLREALLLTDAKATGDRRP